ncbi:tetrahydrofolate dehydrogenase/cyclohydrolase catalytic domain-containing protein [Photobacterium aphoticum]|uniref:Methenyltetrahydrofolate cyclohydrolase n=1 Tax=Photobacterium aphoticum TaxID=754436 RepID=A0A090QNN2_9GAMM|nr:bifunctional 5,10-methylenetetrahydrofolate dehydrogenase/5,10-methenyltetrahydrofolate cyclohydrolase [Photobacterium aphoticum]KLV00409.1 methylenetetrahydrofolate dehydrogenase [Photobacterium aphoticum]PSU59750.1 bifunctional 5,10-methylenetetrahydrofolate dehydrogenase/5,10-methenyltetrahydrofolate cyclohydrolase [Photobacterium aphoticum]GAL03429.1 methenyltetrahydrofolate cyclohydrolase [Photobacterium aphoticum]GHA42639.1 bifunctional protein FolD [Photobacterium aphoticum]
MKDVISSLYDSKMAALKAKIDAEKFDVKLTIVTVGDDPASKVYVRNKIRLFDELGLPCEHITLDEAGTTQADLDVLAANADHPMLFQLPLPNGLVAPDLPAAVDVDGFGSETLGQLVLGNNVVLPCTVQAVIDIIDNHYGENHFAGLKVAVLGRSNIVGKPLAIELINRQSTVSSFNSRSDLAAVDWTQFDVIVVATGFHGTLDNSQFVEGQLIIDVGINRIDGKLVGDVKHHEDVVSAAAITPVPGGVGRLTCLHVLGNAIKLCEMKQR